MKRVCLMGVSFDTGNRGVSALAHSLARLVNESHPGAAISFFVSGRTQKEVQIQLERQGITVKVLNYRLSPLSRPTENIFMIVLLAAVWKAVPITATRKMIEKRVPPILALASADIVGDIRGGDSFSDIYGLKRFITGSLPDIVSLLLGKRLILLPQTFGPFTSRLAKWVAKLIIGKSHRVIARDRESLAAVDRMFPDFKASGRSRYCPDVAFILDVRKPDGESGANGCACFLAGTDSGVVVGINVNGLVYNGGYTGRNMFGMRLDYRLFLKKLAERFLSQADVRICLVSHTFGPPGNPNSDLDASRDLVQRLDPALVSRVVLTGDGTPSELKGIIGACDFFVGSRMHSCIAALSQGIPTVGVAYSGKFRGVFESLEVGHLVVDGRSVETGEAVEQALLAFRRRAEERRWIEGRIRGVKDQVMVTMSEVLR